MTNQFSLYGKNLVVTGASSGIGRCIAVECSRAGANVFLLARDQNRLEETFNMLLPGNHTIAAVDLNEVTEIESVVSAMILDRGPVHGMVHAAGTEMTVPFSMLKPKHFHSLFAVNVIAGFEIARILSQKKYLDLQTGGSYIYISSIRALHGQEGAVAYAASKGALLSGMRSLALELIHKNIRVNAISPSIVKTPMTDNLFNSIPDATMEALRKQHPLGFGEPVDVALCCIYLLSGASRWMTGNNLILDGGYSIR